MKSPFADRLLLGESLDGKMVLNVLCFKAFSRGAFLRMWLVFWIRSLGAGSVILKKVERDWEYVWSANREPRKCLVWKGLYPFKYQGLWLVDNKYLGNVYGFFFSIFITWRLSLTSEYMYMWNSSRNGQCATCGNAFIIHICCYSLLLRLFCDNILGE